MRQEFNKLVEKLKTDPLTAVSVFDNDNFKYVVKTKYGTEIKSEYGSIENLFEKLNKDGHKNLNIQEYRKNGNSCKKIGNPFQVNFSEKQPQNNTQQPMNFGLNGGFGLGFTDIMSLNTDSVLKAKLEARNEILEAKNIELTDKVAELKEQILKDNYSVEKKQGNQELIGGLIQTFAPMLQGMFESKQAGLNAPAQENFSPEKQQLINVIKSASFSDPMAQFLLQVIHTTNTNETFYNEVLLLIQKDNGK